MKYYLISKIPENPYDCSTCDSEDCSGCGEYAFTTGQQSLLNNAVEVDLDKMAKDFISSRGDKMKLISDDEMDKVASGTDHERLLKVAHAHLDADLKDCKDCQKANSMIVPCDEKSSSIQFRGITYYPEHSVKAELTLIGETLCNFIGNVMLEDKEKGNWLANQLKPLLEKLRDGESFVQAERQRIVEDTLQFVSMWMDAEKKRHKNTILGDAFERVAIHFKKYFKRSNKP